MAANAKLGSAGAIFVLAGAWGSQALAAPALVDLVWNSPGPECPSREWMLAEVARVLGGSRGPIERAGARVDVRRGDEGRWHAGLSVDARGAHTERRFEADSCDAIASAAALIVAVAVEGGVPPQAPATPRPEPLASPPTEHGVQTHDSQLVVTTAGVIDDATLPAVGGGGEAAAGWTYRVSMFRLSALVGASLFADQTTSSAGRPTQGGTFKLLATSARACGSIASGPFELGPCVGADYDTMWASGFGWQPLSSKTADWVSLLGSARASWNFSRNIAIFARADALIPLAQPRFEAGSGSPGMPDIPVHHPSAVAARGALGIELALFLTEPRPEPHQNHRE
jgi:hypothetical protein